MTRPLDPVDRHIVQILRDNARTPLVALARAVGRSRSATHERLQRLERSGAIAGYTIRYPRPSGGGVRLWLFVSVRPGAICAKIAAELGRMAELRLCNSIAGQADMIALAELGSLDDAMALRETVATIPGVAGVQAAPMLKVHFDAFS